MVLKIECTCKVTKILSNQFLNHVKSRIGTQYFCCCNILWKHKWIYSQGKKIKEKDKRTSNVVTIKTILNIRIKLHIEAQDQSTF